MPLGDETRATDWDGDSDSLFELVHAIEQLSGARTVDEVAAVMRVSARRMSGADGIAFVQRDGDFCHYLDEDAIEPLWKGKRFPLETCVSGWAMLNRATAVIPDIYLDDRVPHDAYRPTFVKSLVMTPVRAHDPIAAIGAYWATQRTWNRHELKQLEAMARATATALENARLYDSLNEALARRDVLIRELDHRVKNSLATVQAIAFQTQRTAPSPQAFVDGLNGRLQALARAHELLTRGAWAPASLHEVIDVALLAFRPQEASRLVVQGPGVRLSPEAALTLHMAFYELAANAAKHGALSDDKGRVSVTWRADAASGLALSWAETGGPTVTPPTHVGFGSRLIEQGLASDLGGASVLSFRPEGARLEMCAPIGARISLA